MQSSQPPKKIYRSRTDAPISGVSSGVAQYFGIDPTVVRLGFVALTLLGGPGIVLYLLMWLFVPQEHSLSSNEPPSLSSQSPAAEPESR